MQTYFKQNHSALKETHLFMPSVQDEPSTDVSHEEVSANQCSMPKNLEQPSEIPTSNKAPLTPRKQKLKRTLNTVRTRLWREKNRLKRKSVDCLLKKKKENEIETACSLLDKLLPTKVAGFVKSQIQIHSKKSSKGYRWTVQDKLFALSVFYHSRKVYAILKKMFYMPSKTTLMKMLQKTNIYPGFSSNILNALKRKVTSMKAADRQCALIFDEMSIKQFLTYNRQFDFVEGFQDLGFVGKSKFVANHAMAFMVRGLSSKWKQTIGYFLSSGPVSGENLQTLIKDAIDRLTSVGLSVKVTICDQGSNNRKFVDLCGVTLEKPYFTHNNQKIYVMYDPPHLLKSIRNNLKSSGFIYKGEKVKWDYVSQFYEKDVKSKLRLAPKLTDDHLETPPFAKMRVPLAAQVLSHSVAAGINTYCQLGELPKEAQTTADFIEHMDQVFNAMNSRSVASSQKMGHAVSQSSKHLEFFENSLQFFDDLKVDSSNTIYCVNGWKLSIKATMELWHDLHNDHEYGFLLTNRLNQDCIENLFSIIRGKGGHRVNPSSMEFRAAFRQVAFDQIVEQSAGSNCAADTDDILLTMTNVQDGDLCENVCDQSVNPSPSSSCDEQNPPVEKLAGLEYLLVMKPPTEIPEQNVEAYMAGYLLKKSDIASCTTCKEQLVYTTPPDSDLYTFLRSKAYSVENTLHYPTEAYVTFIENIEALFVKIFDAVKCMTGVLARTHKNILSTGDDFLNCDKPACKIKLNAMMKLYIRVRLYHALKTANRRNKSNKPGVKRNRKLMILQHM